MREVIHLEATLVRVTLKIGSLSCLACYKLCILLLKLLDLVMEATKTFLIFNSPLLEVLVLVLTTNKTLVTVL